MFYQQITWSVNLCKWVCGLFCSCQMPLTVLHTAQQKKCRLLCWILNVTMHFDIRTGLEGCCCCTYVSIRYNTTRLKSKPKVLDFGKKGRKKKRCQTTADHVPYEYSCLTFSFLAEENKCCRFVCLRVSEPVIWCVVYVPCDQWWTHGLYILKLLLKGYKAPNVSNHSTWKLNSCTLSVCFLIKQCNVLSLP